MVCVLYKLVCSCITQYQRGVYSILSPLSCDPMKGALHVSVDLKKAVQLPVSEDQNDWIAVHGEWLRGSCVFCVLCV